MKRLLLTFTLSTLSFLLFARQVPCNCPIALEKLIKKVEQEYPGFDIKSKKGSLYDDFKQNLSKQAKTAVDVGCEQILKKYVDFFKDPHLWLASNGLPLSAANGNIAEMVTFDVSSFQDKVKNTKDPIEGIWNTEGYKIGINKVGIDEYTGFIIQAKSTVWKAGELKFKLLPDGRFEYTMLDKSKKHGNYNLHKEGILMFDAVGVAMVREHSATSFTAAQVKEKLNQINGFYFKKLSIKTSIIKLPSFEYHNLSKIDTLITQNAKQIETSENLIIDLRGNPGGTTDAYQKLLPYISGKSIRNTGAEFLATQTYIDNLETYKKTLDKSTSTEAIDKKIAKLKENLGKFVNFTDGAKPVYIETVDVAAKSPKNIIILADKGTGSSAEYLLFVAKQSKKVKFLGTPSYGALDYGNAYLIDFGCPPYQLFMPTYRALRLPDYPIDNIGIQPDVYLDSSIKDWIEFALKYAEDRD